MLGIFFGVGSGPGGGGGGRGVLAANPNPTFRQRKNRHISVARFQCKNPAGPVAKFVRYFRSAVSSTAKEKQHFQRGQQFRKERKNLKVGHHA